MENMGGGGRMENMGGGRMEKKGGERWKRKGCKDGMKKYKNRKGRSERMERGKDMEKGSSKG